MSDVVIAAENIGKRYQLGARVPYKALRDTLTDVLSAPWRFLRDRVRSPSPFENPQSTIDNRQSTIDNSFWALKDVNFEVRQGEVLGIIGRNGAGKSTLLKILNRITEPTEGRIEMIGRVGSLLEVGTGFHPELTGRENVFLNGAILGMKRAEILRKFDEIVAFAEVERFLDTPVKHYSSGMYMRLAFSVAAHLEPEILLVDEVLAVGDAQFQRKCLGKMGEVAKRGRTVLFVSHDMGAVQSLCDRAILLRQGTVVADGMTREVIDRYLAASYGADSAVLAERPDRHGSGVLRCLRFYALSPTRGVTGVVCAGEDITFVIEYETFAPTLPQNVSLSVPFYNHLGQHMFMCWTRLTGEDFTIVSRRGAFRVTIPRFPLTPGRYTVNLWCEAGGVVADAIEDAAVVDVHEGNFFATGRLSPASHGGMLVEQHWTQESFGDAHH